MKTMKKPQTKSRCSPRRSKRSTTRSPLQKRPKRMTQKIKEALGLETPSSVTKPSTKIATKKKKETKLRKKMKKHDDSKEDSSLNVKAMACCLCRCTVDFSDRDFFNWPDHDSYDIISTSTSDSEEFDDEDGDYATKNLNLSKEHVADESHSVDHDDNDNDDSSHDSQFYGVKFPTSFHDSNNALLICDGCDRCFHQRCHFIPVLTIPRSDWYCLICQYQDQLQDNSKKTKEHLEIVGKTPEIQSDDANRVETLKVEHSEPPTTQDLEKIYRIPEEGNSRQKSDFESTTVLSLTLQERFEFHSATLKSGLFIKETKKHLKAMIKHQISSIRMCQASIRAFIGSARSRKALIEKYTTSMKLPQEFAESVARLAQCKMKIREMLLSLQNVIWNRNDRSLLLEWVDSLHLDQNETINQKTRSSSEDNKNPLEVISLPWNLNGNRSSPRTDAPIKKEDIHKKLFVDDLVRTEPRFDIKDYDADEEDTNNASLSDEISDIKCSFCFSASTVADENDILLCDGKGCFRSFHMKCCNPQVTQKMLDDDEKGVWFCPFCVLFANALYYTENEFKATDTEVFDYGDGNENDSVSSWENADDAFPEAIEQFAVSSKWKEGKLDSRSDRILSSILGIEISTVKKTEKEEIRDILDVGHEVDEDDSEDHDFLEEGSSSNSIGSDDSESESGVEWEVEKSELSELSGQESVHSVEDAAMYKRRRSRRLEKEKKLRDAMKSGKMDTANIIYGKRKRTHVDYCALNEILFSSIGAINMDNIDDEEDYHVFVSSDLHGTSTSGDSSESNDEESSNDDDGDDNGNASSEKCLVKSVRSKESRTLKRNLRQVHSTKSQNSLETNLGPKMSTRRKNAEKKEKK